MVIIKKVFFGALIISSGIGATEIGDLAASMKAGEWKELETEGLTPPFLQPNGGSISDITAYGAEGSGVLTGSMPTVR